MRKTVLAAAFVTAAVAAVDGNPVIRAWLVNPSARSATNTGLRAILPDVHEVRVDERYVYVESAGLSLRSLGPLDANDRAPTEGVRKFEFRFPLQPRLGEGDSSEAPLGVVGAFVNGVPIYNPISPVSFCDQNIWHLDAVAALRRNRTQSPLVTSLLLGDGRHSPLIGFAFDGFPIYGPYGWDANGSVRQMRSSYRLRTITRRTVLPDGTELSPSQEGPAVDPEFPLGTFVEDYEYAAGAGDLDEHNGRLARTPEYPDGTYAYFLSSYPYLIGPSYHGYLALVNSHVGTVHAIAPLDASHARQIELTTSAVPTAGAPANLTFSIRNGHGRRIRFLEKVHERPIHLAIISSDLAEFSHIHPELQADDSYSVSYSFPHGGTYWLFADYTRPGDSQSISRFRIDVKGPRRAVEGLRADSDLVKKQGDLQVKLTMPERLRVGDDLIFRFDLSVQDLEPYLGAWAHIMIVSEDRQEFIHAHPQDDLRCYVDTSPWQHSHATPGPSPSSISAITGFRKPGIYRLWIQFQRQGQVVTVPYTIKVEPAEKSNLAKVIAPADALRIRVNSSGFNPARITVGSGKPTVLAFEREDAQNCANSVAFPELGIERPLPAGETALITIPASEPRELHFVCGMKMYRGELVIR